MKKKIICLFIIMIFISSILLVLFLKDNNMNKSNTGNNGVSLENDNMVENDEIIVQKGDNVNEEIDELKEKEGDEEVKNSTIKGQNRRVDNNNMSKESKDDIVDKNKNFSETVKPVGTKKTNKKNKATKSLDQEDEDTNQNNNKPIDSEENIVIIDDKSGEDYSIIDSYDEEDLAVENNNAINETEIIPLE